MKYNWLDKIGLEFEGGWDSPPPGGKLVEDGSIEVDDLLDLGCEEENIGELRSPPMDLKDVKDFIYKNYPEYVNESCGFHIHVSFKDINHYPLIASPAFLSNLRKRTIAGWSSFSKLELYQKRRLIYGGEYSKIEVPSIFKLYQNEDSRYCQINPQAFLKHKTIEFRLHSMYDNPTLIYEALIIILESIDLHLSRAPVKKYKPVKLNLEAVQPAAHIENLLVQDIQVTHSCINLGEKK